MTIIASAQASGYEEIWLDTLPSMTSAHRLYLSLGFREIARYGNHAFPGTRYYGLRLSAAPSAYDESMAAAGVTGVSLRVATQADAPCIGVLATQVFLDTYAPDGLRPALASEVLEHCSTAATTALLARPGTHFVVAEIAGHMVAFAQLTLGATHELIGSNAAVELDRLYVLARFSARGIGTMLLRHAEASSASQGATTLWLTAWVGNSRALAFYARRGYADIGATLYVFQAEEFVNRVFARTLAATATA